MSINLCCSIPLYCYSLARGLISGSFGITKSTNVLIVCHASVTLGWSWDVPEGDTYPSTGNYVDIYETRMGCFSFSLKVLCGSLFESWVRNRSRFNLGVRDQFGTYVWVMGVIELIWWIKKPWEFLLVETRHDDYHIYLVREISANSNTIIEQKRKIWGSISDFSSDGRYDDGYFLDRMCDDSTLTKV